MSDWCAQILRHFLEVFQGQSRPQEQLVQAASLLVLPMLEAGYEAGEAIVDDDALTTMVTIMFDPPDDLASAHQPHHAYFSHLVKCDIWSLRSARNGHVGL